MKNKSKTKFTFGDFITAAYQVWGAGRAGQMVRAAINSGQLVFETKSGFMTSPSRRRFI
jgi:hypothetical protein